jgi:hypothetical protein
LIRPNKREPDGEETDFPIETSKGKIVIVPKADITKQDNPAPLSSKCRQF